MRYWLILFVCAVSEMAAGCGNPDSPALDVPDAQKPASTDRYIPLSVGARWTYRAIDNATGVTAPTESVVQALEDVGGAKASIMAYRVRSTTLIGVTVNWQQDLGTSVVRHREQFLAPDGVLRSDYVFQPNRLRLDEGAAHIVVGATWTETHSALVDDLTTGVKQTANFSVVWTVEAVDAMVTVPAGTFSCLRVRRVQSGFSSSDETHWFARHVGKVKETGPEAKDLTSYSIP